MAEEFEKASKKRSVARQRTTKLITKIETLYNDETVDKNEKCEELNCLLDQLLEKKSTLKELDIKIEGLVSCDELEKDIISVEEYLEKIVRWEGKIKRFLKLEDETRALDSSILSANGGVSMQNDRSNTSNYNENAGESSLLNSEVEVLRDFENNLKYDNERYEVGLPFKGEVDLPNNFEVSKRRLNSLVSRFRRDPVLYENYKSVFEEQLMSGVIEQVDITKDDLVDRIYYAPHHPVIREKKESNRTRLRIVFDMSSKERGSLSLNDNLHSRPNLNPDLLTLLLKFRMNGIGIVADIGRAFLSIGLKEVDQRQP
ncbi:hypothetical protein JTE90_023771 [Oedothorax gibbosus]|uniref:Uncharacterized protein n=1 Tax=Oedothorax gibbosus TaxID=931172 RepID=A0AAV6URD4_9ARAC|nr:hypothetical protein JTE90_023771 [Oedothorax gibbosus]